MASLALCIFLIVSDKQWFNTIIIWMVGLLRGVFSKHMWVFFIMLSGQPSLVNKNLFPRWLHFLISRYLLSEKFTTINRHCKACSCIWPQPYDPDFDLSMLDLFSICHEAVCLYGTPLTCTTQKKDKFFRKVSHHYIFLACRAF